MIVTFNLKDFPQDALSLTVADLLESLERTGLVASVAALRALN